MKTYPVLNLASCHKDVWESGGIAPCIPNLEDEWLASHPDHFPHRERVSSTHLIGG